MKEANARYYLAHGTHPTKFDDLDISIPIKTETNNSNALVIYPQNNKITKCEIWHRSTFTVICSMYIHKTNMRYSKRFCDAYSLNTNDIPNKVCQMETGKKEGVDNENHYTYSY